MVIIGWILIVIGVFFIVLSFVGALTDIVKRTPAMSGNSKSPIDSFANLFTALAKLITAILSGPKWFIVFALGIALLLIGVYFQT